ncbi:uracil-DNA glycosylase [Persicobacter psychrovividus]|uniref:Uracil-DNA glycosylase n=1 Tax=Persicobacter psychrovividus TaxID=387638 RepID=A0ABN6LF73_9BACT|nr:uracil-DNA glycosylase 2 [Persicobacter psychrovividus]
MNSLQLPADWQTILAHETAQPYFKSLEKFVDEAYKNSIVYPPKPMVFNAFERSIFQNTRVVILGQDPYHGMGQAHGLSFSVMDGVAFPPSLRNIFKELKRDLDIDPPFSGNLERWADQGVLLLNATLTVENGKAGSHQKQGWETFTDAVIQKIADEKEHVVFILWGAYAQKKASLIDESKHCILTSAHPSPLSAHRGFLGNEHFSKTNKYLKEKGLKEVEW